MDKQYFHPEVIACSRSHRLKIAYLCCGAGEAKQVEALKLLGFDIVRYRDTDVLCATLPSDFSAVILLDAPSNQISMLVAQVRPMFRYACLVAVSDEFGRNLKVNVMLMGADVCLDRTAGAFEFAAVLLATSRYWLVQDRHKRHGERAMLDSPSVAPHHPLPAKQWRLAAQDRELVSPCGKTLKLSGIERKLMQQFFSRPAGAVVGAADIAGDSDTPVASARLNAVANRLKQKALAKAVVLPIRNVRGEGYVFFKDEV